MTVTAKAELRRWELIDALETKWPGVKFWVGIREFPSDRSERFAIYWMDGPTIPMVRAFIPALEYDPFFERTCSARMLHSVKEAFVRKYGAGSDSLVEISNGAAYAKTLEAQKQFYALADRRVIIRNGKIA